MSTPAPRTTTATVPATVAEALRHARERLAPVSDTARLDATLLLAEVLGADRAYVYAHGERALTAEERTRLAGLLERREGGEPVAYLLGRREFWSLDLTVTADVLIPRPETELLVERALALIPRDASWRVADLGTGSGAIALALASERPRAEVWATDVDAAALAVARANAERLGLERVRFAQGPWCRALDGAGREAPPRNWDLIAANPPYVAPGDPHLAQGDLRFEPAVALTTGDQALSAIETIAAEARAYLRAGGHLLIEHGCDQQRRVLALLARLGYVDIAGASDDRGLPRLACARRPDY